MKNIGFILILVCSALLFVEGQDTSDSAGRSNILALEHAWDQALEQGDVKVLTAIFDDSLIYVDDDGKLLTKAEYMARVKANAAHMEQIVAEEMNVQMVGGTAIVVGTYRVKGVENGKPYLRRGRFTEHGYFVEQIGYVLLGGQLRSRTAWGTGFLMEHFFFSCSEAQKG
jgi:ketosteroid isomerase-like protein